MTEFGAPHLHLRVTDSTNRRARELAGTGARSGTIVTADEQTAGRGRSGRVWSAPAGRALLLSALLAPVELRHALLPLSAPVAVCEAIESLGAFGCRIKWPNDIWIDGRKVAGILIEARPPDWAVLGIGVNVAIEPDEFPADVRWPATSLGGGVSVGEVREAVCEALGRWVGAGDDAVLDAFRARDALVGRRLSWTDAGGASGGGSGVAAGIDERGNLVVERGEGSFSLGSGEVQLELDQS